jgi:hypothetical protein
MGKEKTEKVAFSNFVIKQGNSFSVRIPKMAIDMLNLEEGEKVKVILSKSRGYLLSGEQITDVIKKCKKIRDFDKFSDEKLMVFLLIANSIINKRATQKIDKIKSEKELEKDLIKQFGREFVKDYKLFMKILEKNSSVLSILKRFPAG